MNKKVALIDDQELIHMVWNLKAKQVGVELFCFFTTEEFIKAALPQDSKIYIDSELANEKKGEMEALNLIELGYKEIYLCTGYEPQEFNHIDYLAGIIGKKPPF